MQIWRITVCALVVAAALAPDGAAAENIFQRLNRKLNEAAVLGGHSAGCEAQLALARELAQTVSVTMSVPATIVAKEKLPVTWRVGSHVQLNIPIYLVIDAPGEVRFSGKAEGVDKFRPPPGDDITYGRFDGFLPLTSGAKAPFGLSHAANRARAFVPLHRGEIARQGQLSVLPQRAGRQHIGWAVAIAGVCGTNVLAQGRLRPFTVGLGAPEVVVQDRFDLAEPTQRIADRSGRYILSVFEGRYEVHNAKTGDRLLARPGFDPNFSPTSRFVAARKNGDATFEVYDLISGDLIASFQPGLLAWARNDSVAIVSGTRDGAFSYAFTLGNTEGSWGGCTACWPWENSEITLDADHGFITDISNRNFYLHDFYEGQRFSIEHANSSHYVAGPDDDFRMAVHAQIRQIYGSDVNLPVKRWSLGESIKLSHVEPIPTEEQRVKTQLKFLLKHNELKATDSARRRLGPEDSAAITQRMAATIRRIFDDRGQRMTPSYTRKAGRKYRYYISAVLNQGEPQKAGRINRVSAEEVEGIVTKSVRSHLKLPDELDAKGLIETAVSRVDLRPDRLVIGLSKANPKGRRRASKQSKHLEIPWNKVVQTRRREILLPEGTEEAPPRPIRSETRTLLVTSIARGRRWLDEIICNPAMTVEKIAAREHCSPRKINMTISLAFVAPSLVKAAIDGRLPDGLGVTRLCDLPPDWAHQYRVLGLKLPDPPPSNRVSR